MIIPTDYKTMLEELLSEHSLDIKDIANELNVNPITLVRLRKGEEISSTVQSALLCFYCYVRLYPSHYKNAKAHAEFQQSYYYFPSTQARTSLLI